MKIAIIGTRGVPARYGGFETCAEEISVGLVKKGHSVSVYCRYNNEKGNPKTYQGVKLIYIPHFDSKNVGTLSHSLLSFLHSIFHNYDVVLAFNVGLAPLCLMPKLFGQKIVLNVDGLEWKRRKWGWFARKYFLFCEKIAGFSTFKIITDSKEIQKYYQKNYHINSTYIPYGAHIENSKEPEILKKYGVKKDEYFFIASRLEPENNADLIIKAFHKLQTKKKLLIAGGANYKSKFIEDLNKIKDDRVKLLGPIYDPNHIKELHLGCFAYLHGNEVGGTNPSLLKAMGYGNCILALDVSFNKEVAGDAAIYFEKNTESLQDKLQYIINHPHLRRNYQQKAISRVRRYFSWERIIEAYEKLFKSL